MDQPGVDLERCRRCGSASLGEVVRIENVSILIQLPRPGELQLSSGRSWFLLGGTWEQVFEWPLLVQDELFGIRIPAGELLGIVTETRSYWSGQDIRARCTWTGRYSALTGGRSKRGKCAFGQWSAGLPYRGLVTTSLSLDRPIPHAQYELVGPAVDALAVDPALCGLFAEERFRLRRAVVEFFGEQIAAVLRDRAAQSIDK